ACIPEKVMVCMASRGSAKKLLRVGARIAGRLASDWYAVYVETPNEEAGRIKPVDYAALQENIGFAEVLGAKVVKLKACRVADALVEFARRWESRTSYLGKRRVRVSTSCYTARLSIAFSTRCAMRPCR